MNALSYKTVEKEAYSEFVEKKSVFMSYIKPISSEDEAKAFLEKIRAKHSDATHNVYAYINSEGNVSRFSDDGEPQGTAGMPVFDVLRKEELLGVCVVVTRYFGGILLGGGGLVRAYGRAARDAVEKAGVCMYKRKSRMRFACDYDMSGKLLRELEKLGIEPIEKLYEEKVKLAFLCELDEVDKVSSAIADASQGRCRVEFDEYVYAK